MGMKLFCPISKIWICLKLDHEDFTEDGFRNFLSFVVIFLVCAAYVPLFFYWIKNRLQPKKTR